MCFTKWKAVPISSEFAWKYLSWNMPHKTLRLRCNISLHKMCYPSRSPTNCPQYFEIIFKILGVPRLVVYLIIFDLGFLTKISQIYTQISCLPGCITTEAAFGAGNHKHGTPPVRPVIRKNTALNGWFWKKWNYKYVGIIRSSSSSGKFDAKQIEVFHNDPRMILYDKQIPTFQAQKVQTAWAHFPAPGEIIGFHGIVQRFRGKEDLL